MEMISHQHKRHQPYLKTITGPFQELQKPAPVSLTSKDRLPLVPARREMVDRVLEFDPEEPRHQARFETGRLNVECIDTTPFLPRPHAFPPSAISPDGAILTIAGAKFLTNYEGGDGNDLTLTVVP